MFEVFEHTADVGLRITAPDLDTLFGEAARGLFSLIVENLEEVRPLREEIVRLEERDRTYLFFDWLRELLFRFDSGHRLFSRFDVRVEEGLLEARIGGEPLDRGRHRLDHGLKVERTTDGWLAEVIVDI